MYLRSLELHGFKSFPERTVLRFSGGTTVIVGPNGSGKSNITDAMRWVLGELSSKSIRGSRMEDVIFAGTDDKKPMSFAEVSVTFDDSTEPRVLSADYDEVTVTRRYYRSGDSEYFINRKKVRLRDIYELFMNTGIGREGYSIVGQGRIAEILSKKGEERRGVFEESAGIARYRYRKTESQKRLEETEANMERVEDIENELSSRLAPLERDAARARQYLELYGEKKKLDVALWLYDSDKLGEALKKAENDTELSAHELEMAEDSIAGTSAQLERLYEESQSNKEAAQRSREELSAVTREISEVRSSLLVLEKEAEHAGSSIAAEYALAESAERGVGVERERLLEFEGRQRVMTEECDTARAEQLGVAERIAELDRAVRDRTTELDALLKEQRSAEGAVTDLIVRRNVQESNIANQQRRADTVTSEIEGYEAELSTLEGSAAEAARRIEEYRAVERQLDEELSGYDKETSELRSALSELTRRVGQKQAELDSLDSRVTALRRMREHFDGYNNSIRYVMNEARNGRLRGIRGPVSYLIKVEPMYTVAIETALGAALQNIVTEDEEAAKRSIEALKRANAGRATFYPLTTIRSQSQGRLHDGVDRAAGFVGWADTLVSCDDEYVEIVRYLLARTAVFDDLDNASAAARRTNWRIRAVTLDGQQINSGGSFTGGQTKRDTGILSGASQIDSLEVERAKVTAELSKLKTERNESETRLSEQEKKSMGLTDRRRLIESLIGVEQKSFSETDGRRSTIARLVESMKRDSASLEESSSNGMEELSRLDREIGESSAAVEELRKRREELDALRGGDELRIAELTETLNELRIHLAELTRDLEAADVQTKDARLRIASLESDRAAHTAAAHSLEERVVTFNEQSETKRRLLSELEEKVMHLTEQKNSFESSGDSIELRLTELRRTEKAQSSKKELAFIAHSKNENRLGSLRAEVEKHTSRLWDEYELTYATARSYAHDNDAPTVDEGSLSLCRSSQNELKLKIKALGHVNVEAMDEYNEVKHRYDRIKSQLDDLRAAKEDLLGILGDIERDMKRIFLEAFERINIYFGETFRELFGGGHAEVRLTDPEDALNSGIEINAAPPGKTIKNLSLLSGGEQTFIAIALMFALIRVNPSPFCIFDEIEAALDEVNVARVGQYIKRISRDMQIIMISHRRGTMDIADSLYGVTMQQSGVSRVFTLGTAEGASSLTLN